MARFRRLLTRASLLLWLLVYLALYVRQKHDEMIRDYPVDFSSLVNGANLTAWLPKSPMRWYNGTHIDDRYEKVLSLKAGRQGQVAIYEDKVENVSVVVKTLSIKSRNRISPMSVRNSFKTWTTTWPSEIEASLTLGGRTVNERPAFIPVHDYYLLTDLASGEDEWSWAMVTPLMKRGNLADLAQRVHGQHLSPDAIDNHYRNGSFNQVLSALQWLHQEGYCHDDMKPENIFIPNSEVWLLGDVGNTRQASHPWHSTRLFRRRNKTYAPNCQTDDIRRALKAYMTFLRNACHDRAQFDQEFFEGGRPWSKLYWSSVGIETPAEDALAASESNPPKQDIWSDEDHSGSFVMNLLRRAAVHEILKGNAPWWIFHLVP